MCKSGLFDTAIEAVHCKFTMNEALKVCYIGSYGIHEVCQIEVIKGAFALIKHLYYTFYTMVENPIGNFSH